MAAPADSVSPAWLEEQCQRLQDEGGNLRNLNLNIRQLTPTMLHRLSRAIQDNQRIQIVNLTSSLTSFGRRANMPGNLTTEAHFLRPLGEALHSHVSLTTLHLSYNLLHDATPIASAIRMNQTLTELHLDRNRLNPDMGVALAEALRQNRTLKVLQLGSNQVGEKGGIALAKALGEGGNTSLKTLGLARNELGPGTADALLKALDDNHNNLTLTLLMVDQNPHMPPLKVQKIQRLVNANQSGRYLLHISDYSDESAEKQAYSIQGLLPLVLVRLEPDMMFFFLCEKPSLVPLSHTCG